MTLQTLLALYCLVIVLASTAGGHLPSLIRMTHLRTQLLISFVGGLMLGISLLHLLPHAVVTLDSPSTAGIACLLGIVGMFLLLRAFHPPHAHGFVEAAIPDRPAAVLEVREAPWAADGNDDYGKDSGGDAGGDDEADPARASGDVSDHVRVGAGHHVGHHHGEVHDHRGSCGHDHTSSPRGLSWIGILIGLWLHTMIDGVALAASAVADAQHSGISLAGLGTFLAIALHKPLDAFAITSTMRSSGWSPMHQGIINVVFAVACPVGALLFYFGVTQLSDSSTVLGWGLAISAGFFICISLADLLPEVSFHQHDRGKLTLSLVLGIALAFVVENLPGHSHIHSAGQPGSEVMESVLIESEATELSPDPSRRPR